MKRHRMADLIFLDGEEKKHEKCSLCLHKVFKSNWEDTEKENQKGERIWWIRNKEKRKPARNPISVVWIFFSQLQDQKICLFLYCHLQLFQDPGFIFARPTHGVKPPRIQLLGEIILPKPTGVQKRQDSSQDILKGQGVVGQEDKIKDWG